jgi:pimeloyl-ACP methyl ester carboxylesterase
MEPLSQLGSVIAYDRPAFGLTERPLHWEGQNPYGPETQVDLLVGLLDHIGAQQAILIGHSAGGTIALQAALKHPDRISALILVNPAVYSGGGVFTLASHASGLSSHLDEFLLPVLAVTGDDDRIVPTCENIRLSEELPNAQLVVIPDAGHVPHEEQPEAFVPAVSHFLNELKDASE